MKKNRVSRVSAFLMILLAGSLAMGNALAEGSKAALKSATEAQQRTVTGKVVDAQGNPVPGASVMIAGTNRGAVTATDGSFSLAVPDGAELEVSFLGYITVTVPARNGMTVVLNEDTEYLEEVVVVGYGTQKKANLTGAVSTVDVEKTLDSKSETNLGKALQGAVPGLTVININGDINADPTITIRGIGTLSNSGISTPLYIVDGVPIDNISFLNPQDIENISVLKDAASTSIYGTRAAFGVVMITTKAGKVNDRAIVRYTNNFGWSQATNLADYDILSKQVAAFNEVNKNMGVESELFGIYFDDPKFISAVDAWEKKHNGKAPYREMVLNDDYYLNANGSGSYVADWDVVGIVFNNATPSQNHTLSIQGTSGKTNYYMSVGMDKQQGIMNFNPDKLHRYTATVNVSSQIKKWLNVGARVNYMNKNYEYPYTRGMGLAYVWRWPSNFGPYGTIDGIDARNIIGYRKQAGDAYDRTANLRLGAFATATVAKGLTINADYTYTNKTTRYKGVGIPLTVYNSWGNIQAPSSSLVTSTFVETSRSFTNGYTANLYAKYQLDLAKNHHFQFMLGSNVDESEYEYLYYENHDVMDPALPELALTPTFYSYTHRHTWWGSAGFFGRINYNYADKILVELNGRYDGSSKFPANSRWAFFPSASIGYRISQEGFWEPIKPVINNAKIRASYGVIGNQEVGTNMFIETMTKYGTSVNWLGTGTSKYDYFGLPKLVSADLTWESLATTDIGVDLGFLNGDLNVTFDWFQRDTKGMLAPGQTMPAVLGTSAAYENAGSLRSRGWEVNVDWHHSFGDVNLYAIANLSDYKTKVTYWKNDAMQLNTTYTGKTYGDIWGFETDRYFTSASDVASSASQKKLENGNFHYGPGDIKFVDQDGDGEINWGKGTEEDHGDLVKIGNTTPRYQYSLRLGGEWNGFDLDIYLQGVGKRNIWTVSQFVMPYSRGADAIYKGQMNYVSLDQIASGNIDQNADHPRLYGGAGNQGTISSNIITTGRYNYYPQSRYILNMAYLRLKNVTLGYTIPKNLTKQISIDKVRVYVATNNILDIINHNRTNGIDPEMNDGSGVSWGRVNPLMKTYSCGVQVTF